MSTPMRPESLTTRWRAWSCRVEVVVDTAASSAPAWDLTRAEAVVRDLMDDVARAVSRFDPDSELELVNARAGALVPVSGLTVMLVQRALDAARDSSGAVDPTIGAHLVDAGYDADIDLVRRRSIPGSAEATAPRRVPPGLPMTKGWASVVVDTELRRVGVPAGVRLDLGATAKAWTADEAARRVSAVLRRGALVAIGGDVAVAHPPGEPADRVWQVAVAEREVDLGSRPGTARTHQVGLRAGGIATSSTLSRTWEGARGRAHHVIDPATGFPVTGPFRTVSVWAASCLEANTWSTAALVHGTTALDILCRPGLAARLVRTDGEIVHVGSWPVQEAAA